MPSLLKVISFLLWLAALGGFFGNAMNDPATAFGCLLGFGTVGFMLGRAATREEEKERELRDIQLTIARRVSATGGPSPVPAQSSRAEVGVTPAVPVTVIDASQKVCPSCGQVVNANARVCRHCSFNFTGVVEAATAPDLKKCPDCAEMVKAEARKCRFCGFQFEGSATSSSPTPPPPSPQPPSLEPPSQ